MSDTSLKPVHGLFAIVGFLVCVEIASGVLQGFYTPIYPDSRRAPRHPRGRDVRLVRGGSAGPPRTS